MMMMMVVVVVVVKKTVKEQVSLDSGRGVSYLQ